MSRVHVTPDEAVDIYEEMQGTKGVAIHWATWQLSAEEVMAPKLELEKSTWKECRSIRMLAHGKNAISLIK